VTPAIRQLGTIYMIGTIPANLQFESDNASKISIGSAYCPPGYGCIARVTLHELKVASAQEGVELRVYLFRTAADVADSWALALGRWAGEVVAGGARMRATGHRPRWGIAGGYN
jgi:hypothetical protein